MPNSRTKLFGVIGDPVGHSLSPTLQNYFLKKFKINAVYLAFRVLPANLQACVSGAGAMGIAGLNVTLPHKEKVASLATYKSPVVNLLGVANTLCFRDDGVTAFVTDPAGFLESLADEKSRFGGSRAVLFGAGGAARSVAYCLSQLGVYELVIANRSQERALQLIRFCETHLAFKMVQAIGLDDPSLNDHIEHSLFLVNATSMGMAPYLDESPLKKFAAVSHKHLVYDLIYNPIWTFFLSEAQKRGAQVKNGLDMLIYQGLESLRIWMNERYELDKNGINDLRIHLLTELPT